MAAPGLNSNTQDAEAGGSLRDYFGLQSPKTVRATYWDPASENKTNLNAAVHLKNSLSTHKW